MGRCFLLNEEDMSFLLLWQTAKGELLLTEVEAEAGFAAERVESGPVRSNLHVRSPMFPLADVAECAELVKAVEVGAHPKAHMSKVAEAGSVVEVREHAQSRSHKVDIRNENSALLSYTSESRIAMSSARCRKAAISCISACLYT
mmetsp:Transcript_3045/g.5438  ORF Transcript_3045/g.5438 Transcript_3045/m.5438 type:complete len:145 (-) Transcript_3045:35-469(-)